MPVTVRCPTSRCRDTFEVADARLGRNIYCLACGNRMTARPASTDDMLQRRAERVAGSPGTPRGCLPYAALLDNVRSLWNVGSIFRSADACATGELVLAGITGHPPREQIAKTALGAEEVVAWRYRADPVDALDELGREGFTPVALEETAGAHDLDRFEWPDRPCLVVGNEVAGLSPAVLDRCEHAVRIPMRGSKRSLNVAVAFGIAAHRLAGELST